DPAHRSLCTVNLDGSGFEVLLRHDGDLQVPVTEPCGLEQDRPFRPVNASPGIGANGRFAAVRYTSVASGNQLKIVDLKDRNELVMASETPLPEESPAPRHFVATAADNTTTLHGVMFLPSDFDAARRYPLINYIYPGPQMAWQPQACHSLMPMLARALAEVGF